jgi:glycosyltransferase involved in cell wall biosynthesis
MNPRLRLLYSSNIIGCPSGYGIQGLSLLPRLAELPEFGGEPGSMAGRANIGHHAWYGLHGLTMNYQGFQIYPGFDDPYGNDVIGTHTQHFGANIVVTLIDVWVLHQTAEKVAPALWLPWLPIDHDPIPQRFLDALKGAYLPLTYAKWGHEMLTAAGVENHYIPHGIETSIYRVDEDREQVRKFKRWLTGDETCFLCVMVAANKGFPDRKWFQGQLECFRDFRKANPEANAKLYIHSLPTAVHGGLDFELLVKQLGIEGHVIFPHPYLYRLGYPQQHLALVYNAADVLLAAAMSEGFGIPIVEAQACGTPVITTNFSAMPELLRWGHLVEVGDMVLTGMHSYQALPSKRSMLDKMQRLYEAWTLCGGEWPMSKRTATQNAIHAEYDWDAIVRDQWAPLIARLADEAPALNQRFQGVDTSVGGFVSMVQEELAKDAPLSPLPASQAAAAGVPRRRVGPLVQIKAEKTLDNGVVVAATANGYEAEEVAA